MAQEKEKEKPERRGRRDRRDGDGGRGRDDSHHEAVIQIKRCAAVVKGGRRFSFNALVVVGDKGGNVGYGYGKAQEVPHAVDKAVKAANKALVRVPRKGTTVPHQVLGRFGAAKVIIIPAAPGTGVIAGRGVRDVMVAAGITDVLTKCMGSTNPLNVVKATLEGLRQLRTADDVVELRGVSL